MYGAKLPLGEISAAFLCPVACPGASPSPTRRGFLLLGDFVDGTPEERNLVGKQKLFCDAYLGPARLNGTEAARQAGYKGNDHTLSQVAYENLRKPEIRAYIEERLNARAMSANEVLAELSDIARADWRDFVEIQTNKYGRTTRVKMDLTNKVRSLELLGKGHQLFTDNVQHSGEVLIRGYGDVPVDDV